MVEGRSLPSSVDVAVVGGGFAGLVAARDLAAAGRTVHVFEARDRLGGRTFYETFPGTERGVELGGTWISPRFHPMAMAEIDRYGLDLVGEPESTLSWSLDGGPFATGLPVPEEDLYDLERAMVEIVLAARRIDPQRRRDVQGGLEDLDVTVEEWVRSHDLPESVQEFIFTMASLGMGASESEWSALDAFSLLAGMGCSPYGWLAAAGTKIATGSSSLIEALAAHDGVSIHLNAPVAALEESSDAVWLDTAAGSVTASRVVMATPVNTWSQVKMVPALQGPRADLAQQRHRGRMQKLWLLVDDAPDGVFALGRRSDFLALNTQYRLPQGVLLVAFASAPSTFHGGERSAVEKALAQVLPDSRLLDYRFHDWEADPWSRGTWIGYPTGYLSRHASEIAAHRELVKYAGADIATTWLGWIEGAIETGRDAARSIVEE